MGPQPGPINSPSSTQTSGLSQFFYRFPRLKALGRTSSPLHFRVRSVTIPKYISDGEVGLKIRGWLMMLLFAHVMLHPWVHSMGLGKAIDGRTLCCDASTTPESTVATADQCELCRSGANATPTPPPPTIELLNPHWIHIALLSVNYESLQADVRVPSRAPPLY